MMKFSRAISRVKWLSGEQTNVDKATPPVPIDWITFKHSVPTSKKTHRIAVTNISNLNDYVKFGVHCMNQVILSVCVCVCVCVCSVQKRTPSVLWFYINRPVVLFKGNAAPISVFVP